MHKTGWANIDLPPHLKKAREKQKCFQLNFLERYRTRKKKEEELDIRLENFGFYKRICCYTMLVSHESVFNS